MAASNLNYARRGTKEFNRICIALFLGGFNTFAILWSTQAFLPEIANEFQISPTLSSLTLSAATITLAFSLLVAGSLSEVYGRKSVMTLSLVVSSVLAILTAFCPNFPLFILGRILQGMMIAGLPAVAMAYLGEEIEPESLGMAMGLLISGNSLGGMSGRVLGGVLADILSWRTAVAVIGVISLIASLVFWRLLPESSHFKARRLNIGRLALSMLRHVKSPGLPYLFSLAFLLMSGFASAYNYISFVLVAPPYNLSQSIVGGIFIVFIVGSFSSTFMGSLADRHGRQKLIQLALGIFLGGALITLSGELWLKILGLAVFTFGYFGAHSIASGWVSKLATRNKAQASGLYLFCYYLGSSIGGTMSGNFYSVWGWPGVIAMITVLALISLFISIRIGSVLASRKQKVMCRGQADVRL